MTDERPCKGTNANVCVAEGCYGEACICRPDDRADEQIEAAAKVMFEFGDQDHGLGWGSLDIGLKAYRKLAFNLSEARLLATPADQDNAIWALADRANFYQRAWESMRGRLGHEMDLRKRAEAERDLLRAQVAAVRALADEWDRTLQDMLRVEIDDLRAALNTTGGEQHGE
jgi:hypothetical protein